MAGLIEDGSTGVHFPVPDKASSENIKDDVHPVAARIQEILIECGVPAASADEIISVVDVLAVDREVLILILADTLQRDCGERALKGERIPRRERSAEVEEMLREMSGGVADRTHLAHHSFTAKTP